MNKEPITVTGLKSLKSELENLKNIQRPKIVEAIAEARSHGDLKENAEYHAAKEKQSFIEGRIKDIESKLSNSEIIDITNLNVSNKVVFGSTVTIINIESGKENKYKIVGEDESDIDKGLLSYKAPVSRAMIGKSIDDLVEIVIGDENQSLQILNIEYI